MNEYGEIKKRRSLSITETAWVGLRGIAREYGYPSLSGFLEALGRRDFLLAESLTPIPEIQISQIISMYDLNELERLTGVKAKRWERLMLKKKKPLLQEVEKLIEVSGLAREIVMRVYRNEYGE